ncbi:D-alanyl-D-alanine carboxypeptidase/D-alanyl-D-alanine-endopeptidase (penicillin-binding protein 4) [Phycicoccus badiiscoriae]|uniref:D-alanyl-D-alanine carboxypeptidase/D-alanyl-D-alanine-endopeptidase (Penicillin-binding protein 4) n=1 Tax=Pedococcus badiiscoriae TaxID=642776 RepID=A0A852WM80_9MICO|nr:D-alanyl-D-alanine carboxypeptidase/D-alanyl-D-alanine-endopeptidase (penicillin-binding protein 4) [Pedococcus badiiscoriae]
MRRILAALLAFVVLAGTYVTLDVFDLVPGILTRAQPQATPTVVPPSGAGTPTTVAVPTVDAGAQPLQPASASARIPDPTALAKALAAVVADPALRPGPGVVVRDAFTGQTLLSKAASRARVPASTAKLLTALAVDTTLNPLDTLPTTVVQGTRPDQIVLVAGGDTMLATGKGVPTAVEGRAGLADLAEQVASSLQGAGTTQVTLRLDTTYAKGPRWAPGWNPVDVTDGYTGGVSMLGLAGQRARPFKPAPRDPEAATAAAFVGALAKVGISATLAPESTWSTQVPKGATELGRVESAPIGEILALALDDSDNALTEGLARQAAVKAGGAATFASAVAFVRRTVEARGIDLTGAVLKDTSGLTAGQAIPPQVLSDVLQLGADGSVPAMQDTISRLPVAGLTGTLADRFHAKSTRAVAGLARAKTGTLTGVSAMAGTVIDADGRVLSFVVQADGIPAGVGTLNARAALDRFVAVLAACGCP